MAILQASGIFTRLFLLNALGRAAPAEGLSIQKVIISGSEKDAMLNAISTVRHGQLIDPIAPETLLLPKPTRKAYMTELPAAPH